jgi:ADP-ribosylglycohydrolase
VLHEHPEPWADAVTTLRRLCAGVAEEARELNDEIHPNALPERPGSGYVVDCLLSARDAVEAGGYEAAVKAAILMGHDTDTTACVAGGVAGLRDGIAAIPERWRRDLRGHALYQPLLEGLLAYAG